MFERFTQQALSVLAVAQQEAAHHRCAYIGTEHLLVGLVADPESLSAQILQASGVSPEIVRAAIEAAVGALETSKAGRDHLAIRAAIAALDAASKDFATRRMNQALQQGLRGQDIGAVESKVGK